MIDDTPTTPPRLRKLITADNPSSTVTYTPPTPSSDTSSPRTAVANRLSEISLQSLYPEHQQSPRKRVRTTSRDPEEAEGSSESGLKLEDGRQSHGVDFEVKNTEVPLLQSDIISNAPPLSSAPPPSIRQKISPKPKLKRKGSPPPSAPIVNDFSDDTSTWQEHEITGHLMMDEDDDGTGINGIGFRPTAAIAYARSQKRKQQLSEWKARESKEARAARGQRRRKLDGEMSREPSFNSMPSGGSDDAAARSFEVPEGDSLGKRRSVRFI
jgi:hypothetical protein